MDQKTFDEIERIISKIRKNRNHYINKTIWFYNFLKKRKLLAKQLQKESKLVREESMKILADFEKAGIMENRFYNSLIKFRVKN